MGQISRRGDKESDKPMIVGQGVERQKRQQVSGGVSENCPHRRRHLNVWSPVGGAIWVRLGGRSLGACLAVSKPHVLPCLVSLLAV